MTKLWNKLRVTWYRLTGAWELALRYDELLKAHRALEKRFDAMLQLWLQDEISVIYSNNPRAVLDALAERRLPTEPAKETPSEAPKGKKPLPN